MKTALMNLQKWLLIKIAHGRPVVLNVHMKAGLHFDHSKSRNLVSHNINVQGKADFGVKFD